jgi:type IV secretion system protein VirB4
VEDLRPEQWLQAFYDNRKGSGKGRPKTPSPAAAQRSSRPAAL